MVAYNRYTLRYSHPGRRFSARGVVFLLVIFGVGFGFTGYAYFASGSAKNGSLYCNLQSTSYDSNQLTSRTPQEIDSCPALAPGCQEILELTGDGETLFSLMNANLVDEDSVKKVSASLAAAIRKSLGKPFDENTPLEPGRRYNIVVDENGAFLKATIEIDPANVFHAIANEGEIQTSKEDVVLDFKIETIQFRMEGTLTDSVLKAGEGRELARELSNVFRWDIDFQSESMRGDICKVVFERRYADDRPSGYGNVLLAIYEGKKTGKKTAVLFNKEYYDENGTELKKPFLRSPLAVLRKTSDYGARFHPVLRVWKKHNGVDYGAPAGTPVYSVANGVVTFAGWHNGYGNYVCIKHDNGYESRYGHLKRIDVAVGARVKQRQRIGLVGQTGIATGPHLDFQLLVNNKHINPHLSMKSIRNPKTIPEPLRPRFAGIVDQRLARLLSFTKMYPGKSSLQ